MVPIRYGLRSLVVRKATTIATSLGIALVVLVLAGTQMLAAGLKRTLNSAGKSDVAIVLRKGSDNEMGSTIEEPQIALLTSMTGIRQVAGKPLSASEIVVVTASEKVGEPGITNMMVRGVEDSVLTFRPSVKIVAGRAAVPGTDEAMVGARIRGRFVGVDLGQSLALKKNRRVTVVGVFEDAGSSHESEVWVSLETLRATFGREGTRSSVRVKLDSASSFDAYKSAVEQDKRLGLSAMRETAYYEKLSEGTSLFITVLGVIISVFFSVGAIIGAAITMYAAVANRQREIGILRALGFSRFSIMVSFVIESLLLSLTGGVIGMLLASSLHNTKRSMMNFASWSEIVFTFELTPAIVIGGLVFSLVMGLLGGLLPSIRAARVSPVVAMRA
jgi:putative ABC transport system permease protein